MQLSASAVSIERGGRPVVSNLSFVVGAGEALFVTGRNGAGKSTLLRALAGLLPLAGGMLSATPAVERLAEQAHYIGHADALKSVLTSAENLAFWAAIFGGDARTASVEAALRRFGLAGISSLPAAYLSAGQKRRLSLAKLLVAPRPLWLLDEPTTALDAVSRGLLIDIMRDHLANGGTIVAATHTPLDIGGRELPLGRI